MNIAISGASGFIGKHLTEYLTEVGYRVIPLGRSMFRESSFDYLIQTLSCCDVIINLAGAPIGKRWTPEYKKELYDSRIKVTRRIIRAMEAIKSGPRLMISASAVGYYSEEGMSDEYINTRGTGFLAELCYAWEREANCCPPHVRLAITRFGIVLSPDGGAMRQMLRPIRMTRTAGVIAPGTQPFPWISIRDLCRALEFIITHQEMSGVFNLVSPQQISQYKFTQVMATRYRAWMKVVVPRWIFRVRYGEAAAFLTSGQNVRPTRLLEYGFYFVKPTIEEFFQAVDRTTVDQLDLQRYMGMWYEIARFDHRFERGLSEVTATYKLMPDGTVRVENRGCKYKKPYDVCKKAEGRAKRTDPSQPGKLKVSFFLFFYSDYYVLELDQLKYNYALIGSSSDNYLWILSRTPFLSDEIKKKLLSAATRRGYDVKKLIWVKQRDKKVSKIVYE